MDNNIEEWEDLKNPIGDLKHTGGIETKDGFICETCHQKFRTDYELLAHQGTPVIYTQEDMDKGRLDAIASVFRKLDKLPRYYAQIEREHKAFGQKGFDAPYIEFYKADVPVGLLLMDKDIDALKAKLKAGTEARM